MFFDVETVRTYAPAVHELLFLSCLLSSEARNWAVLIYYKAYIIYYYLFFIKIQKYSYKFDAYLHFFQTRNKNAPIKSQF